MLIKTKNKKLKKLVRLSFLAIGMLFFLNSFLPCKAESTRTIYLNRNINLEKNIRFEKVSTKPNCVSTTCFKTPNDIAIASDESFFVVVDSGSSTDTKIYLRKISLTSTKDEIIPLNQKSSDIPLLTIKLSQNNQKVLVYREPTKNETTLVQIVDLTTKSIKELTSVSSTGFQIGAPSFFDSDGKKLIAGSLSKTTPELVIIDIESDQIINRVALPDVAQSINVSPKLKRAIITYKDAFAQSISIYEEETNSLTRLDLDPAFSFDVDDFLSRVEFDLTGSKATVSSLGGSHVFHFVDLENKKLKLLLLDKSLEGTTLTTFSPDGSSAYAVGSLLDTSVGFKIYKVSFSKDGNLTLSNSAAFEDGSIVLDVDVTPDQSKVLVLVLRNDKKQLIILNPKDLSKISELSISSDNAQSSLLVSPFGRFALTANTNTEVSISVIEDFNSGPIFRSIAPTNAPANSNTPFTINGYFDLTRFTEDIKVCFGTNDVCAQSPIVSRNLQTLSGFTPKVLQTGSTDLIITAKSKQDGSIKSSKYENVFQFTKELATVSDSIPPDVKISEKPFSSKKGINVSGIADGTGSTIESVSVNDKKADLTVTSKTTPNVVSFFTGLEAASDGPFEIKIIAQDKAQNKTEKVIKITVDTVIPQLTAKVESTLRGDFKVTGTANGTGTKVSSILVNSVQAEFTEGESVTFIATAKTTPVTVTVLDQAGNKNELTISSATGVDATPPLISVSSPNNGDVFKDNPNISVNFTVSDNTSVKEVTFNGSVISPISSNQYSQNLVLIPGSNKIEIKATDINNNTSTLLIRVTFITEEKAGGSKEAIQEQAEKIIVPLPPVVDNLNNTIIDEFKKITSPTEEPIKISDTLSVEFFTDEDIPEGPPAEIKVPEVIKAITPEGPLEIPTGFAFASDITFKEKPDKLPDEEVKKQNAAILVDASGRTFIVGFAFFKEAKNNNLSSKLLNKNYKFQTTGGKDLDLITTFSVPGDATEGDARVEILSGDQSLAKIPFRVVPSTRVVKIGKREIAKPQIKKPIVAKVTKKGTNLTLQLKGKNFVGKIATIDGKLQRLIGKAKFFTNVTFVPDDGITIKNLKVLKNKLVLQATLSNETKPGIKLFNVITPKGADIGGIVFPDPIIDGKLEADTPESLILEE